jgi:hypothetical protein
MATGSCDANRLEGQSPLKGGVFHLKGYDSEHWQTTALRCVSFGVFFPKETGCESQIEFKDR